MLICLAFFPFSGAAAEIKCETVYTSGSPLLCAVGGQGVLFSRDGVLLLYPENAREAAEIARAGHIVSVAADNREDLFYYLTEEDGVQALYTVTGSGASYGDAVPLPEGQRILQLDADGGRLYALNEAGVLYSVFPYGSGADMMEIRADGWQNGGVSAFSVYDGLLAVYRPESETLSVLRLGDEIALLQSAHLPAAASVQAVQTADGQLYAFALAEADGGQALLRVSMADGRTETVDTNLPKDCAALRRDRTKLYALGKGGTALYALPLQSLTGASETPTLTFVNLLSTGQRFDRAAALFHEKYPDVELVRREMNDMETLVTEMMAGSADVDLLAVQESAMFVSSGMMLRAGALLDLNRFDSLTALKARYRDIWGWTTLDGKWFGVPESPYCPLWKVNTALAEAIGWEIPEGRWTWADFAALSERVMAYNQSAEKPIVLLKDDGGPLPYFLTEYQANHVDIPAGKADYNTDAYVGVLALWQDLCQSGLVDVPIRPVYGREALLTASPNSGMPALLSQMGSDRYILPPTETETSLYPVYDAGFLVLNANTRHLEEAVYFLACYLSPEAERTRVSEHTGKWLRDGSGYTDYSQWAKGTSPENEAAWYDALEHSAPAMYLLDISRQQYWTLLPGLLDGSVTPERFAEITQQLADMAFGG